jgi:Mg-chelatase subunit ChlD
LAGLLLAACGGGEDSQTDEPAPQQATEQAQSSESTTDPEAEAHDNESTKEDTETPEPITSDLRIGIVDGEDASTAVVVDAVDALAENLRVLVSNDTDRSIRGTVAVTVGTVAGTPSGAKVADTFGNIAAREHKVFSMSFRDNELQPGRYKVSITTTNDVFAESGFEVTVPNMALFLTRDNAPAGANIALAALGGEIVGVSDSNDQRTWKPDFLIDGFTRIHGVRHANVSEGWQARGTSSAEIVVAFKDREPATIDAVGLSVVETTASPRTLAAFKRPSPIPKGVEIWVSDSVDGTEFSKAAEARIYRTEAPQLVRFEPTSARFLKLKILDNHGANEIALAELMVFESAIANQSILGSTDINIAIPALGGYVVSASTAGAGNEPWQLIDGASGAGAGWMSAATDKRSANYTPQDLVFGFGNNNAVLINYIEIDPLSGPAGAVGDFSSYQAREIALSVAGQLDSEWEDVGRLEMPPDNSRHKVAVGKKATRVRVRVLSNHGGKASGLGEVRIVEGKAPGYKSIVPGADRWFGPESAVSPSSGNEQSTSPTPPGIRSLDNNVKQLGRLVEVGQVDEYSLRVETVSTAALTIHLTGSPNVRTSLRLLDERGSLVKSYMPSAKARNEESLSWLVTPGRYRVEASATPINQVIAFDTSGSMGASIFDLERAVRTYVSNARNDEFINLVQFNEKVIPVLPDFSTDSEQILKSLDGLFEAEGSTSLVDAMYESAVMLMPRDGRQVIVSFTDGQDTSSETSKEQLSGLLAALSLQLYSIGLGESMISYNQRTASTGHQFLSNTSRSGPSDRYFAVSDGADIAAAFDAIGGELRAPSNYSIAASVSDAKGELRVSTTGEMIPGLSPPRFELILDASGSMKRATGSANRMAVAKRVLTTVLEQVPDNTEVALRVFGHRVLEGQSGDCQDSELLVPFGAGQKSKLSAAIDRITALGTTPIAYSVEQAIRDLKTDEKVDTIIILVTDGEEECRDDLLEVVQKAQASGTRFSMNVVGFELDEKTTTDMALVAEASGGGYFAAGSADELDDAMIKVLSAPFSVLDGSGEVVAKGVINGGPLSLYAGTYSISVDASGVTLKLPNVNVPRNGVRTLRLNRQGDSVGVER